MRLNRALAVGLVGLSSMAFAANSMYRWVDASGQVHYSQTPPKSGGFKEVKTRPTAPSAARVPALATSKATPATVPSPGSVADMNKKTAEYNASVKAQNCKNSQTQLAQVKVQGPGSALRQQADGSVAPYGPDDYQRDLASAQKAVSDSCAP